MHQKREHKQETKNLIYHSIYVTCSLQLPVFGWDKKRHCGEREEGREAAKEDESVYLIRAQNKMSVLLNLFPFM